MADVKITITVVKIFRLNLQMTSKNFMRTSQLDICIKDGLIACKVLIDSKITLNHFILPGNKKLKKSQVTLVRKTFYL